METAQHQVEPGSHLPVVGLDTGHTLYSKNLKPEQLLHTSMPIETTRLLESDGGATENAAVTRYSDDDEHALGIRGPEVLYEGKESTNLLSVFIPMIVGLFLAAMDGNIVVSSYAAIGSEFKQLQNISWIATGYMLTLTCFQPLYGKMSNIFGRKQCLIFAYCVFALGSLWCGISQNLQQLIAGRALAGIGGGGMSTVVSIITSDIVPLRSRGTWQGIINVIFAVGAGTGAPLGGFLADSIGWRWIFLIQVPATLIAIVSVSIALKLPARESTDLKAKLKRVDFAGSTALILCIFSLLVALDRGGNESWSDPLAIIFLGAFVFLFFIFMAIEEWFAVEPFAPRLVIWGPSLIASYLVNFFSVAAGTTTVFHTSLYYQAVRELKASEAGMFLIPSILSGVAGSLAAGLLMQATGRYYSLTVIAYTTTVAGAAMTFMMAGTVLQSDWGVALGLTVYGLGNGIGITTSLVSLIVNAGSENQAIATAASYLYRSLGAVVGVSVGNTLLQNGLRRDLKRKLTGTDVEEINVRIRESLAYLGSLDPETITIVRSSYAHGVQFTLAFAVGMTICAFLCSFFIREKSLGSQDHQDGAK